MRDVFGIRQLYPSMSGGKEWVSKWASPARTFTGVDPADAWFDADHGDATYKVPGNGTLVITGGVVAYLQRSDPALLKLTAPGAADSEAAEQAATKRGGWRTLRPLLIGLAFLMVLSPLGLLAAGTAWGEWGAGDFTDPAMRQQIETASGQAPPAHAPQGLERLSTLWNAPLSGYAPSFISSAELGYILSAVVGTGLIILAFFLISWLARVLRRGNEHDPAARPGAGAA